MKKVLKYTAWGLTGALWIWCAERLMEAGQPAMALSIFGGIASGVALGGLLSMLPVRKAKD